jgi:hypothetical protein
LQYTQLKLLKMHLLASPCLSVSFQQQ